MKTKHLFYLLIISSFILLSFESARACDCRFTEAPCNGFNKTDVIFSGEIIDVNKHQAAPDPKDKVKDSYFSRDIQLRVFESFNGTKTENIIVRSGAIGSDCSFDFKKGERYLVYGHEDNGEIYVTRCSRTNLLDDAQNDLEILREIKTKGPVSSHLFGRIALLGDSDPQLLPSVKVTATSKTGKTYETASSKFGDYHFANLPNDEYYIRATYKESFIKTAEIIIEAAKGKRCIEKHFGFFEGGQIVGRIVDNEGQPIAGLRVYAERLIFSPEDEKGANDYSSETDKNGIYTLEGLKKGTYVLRTNHLQYLDKDFPFPTTYYPQAASQDQAQKIEVTGEKGLNDFNFQLPPRLKTKAITGVILFTNGKPAIGAEVRIREESTNHEVDYKDVDTEGRFTLKVVEGNNYYLYIYKKLNAFVPFLPTKKIYLPQTANNEPLKIQINPLQ